MNKATTTIVSLSLFLLIPITTLTTANALNELQQPLPPKLHDDAIKMDNQVLALCDPYALHQNDNVIIGHLTQTCYNAMAGISNTCNPVDGILNGDMICQDPRVVDFTIHYYDPVNRPWQPLQGTGLGR